jgi:glycosyltransferase involved in cell wall biosynthesis
MDTLQFIRYLQDRYEILLVVGGGDRDEFEAAYLTEHLGRVRIVRLPQFQRSINVFKDTSTYFHLKKLLADFRPHIVHTHNSKTGLLGRWAAHRLKVPVILHTYHGLLFHSYFNAWFTGVIKWMDRKLANVSTRIIALSESQKNELVQVYQIADAQKVVIVPLGIEVDNFHNNIAAKRQLFRQKYLLQDQEIAIGIVGRIVPVKNHAFFLRVAQAFEQQGIKNIRFFVIGDGELRKKLEQQCQQSGINYTYFPYQPKTARVTFTSWITEIEKAIAGLDIVALTSLNEGTPVSLIEAQAAGKPVMANLAGGIEDIMQDSVTGFCCEQNNLAQFVDRLKQLCSNAALRDQMGNAGYAFIQNKYNKQLQVNRLDALYQQLLLEVATA